MGCSGESTIPVTALVIGILRRQLALAAALVPVAWYEKNSAPVQAPAM